jgi:MarR family transcriptional regulator, 2-MHQ and catechol-resistance regulon repressor
MVMPLSEQAKQLHKAVKGLVQKYQCRDRNDICCYGISVSQCYTLETLAAHGTLPMQALAEQLQLAISTVTRIVDQLVDKGLAERHSAAWDRRVCQVTLTAAGTKLLSTIQAELLSREEAILQRLPVEARDHVIWAVEELSRAVDDWRKTVACDPPEDTKGAVSCRP